MTKFTARIRKSGGSLIITIDKDVVKIEGLKVGDYIEVDIKKIRKPQS